MRFTNAKAAIVVDDFRIRQNARESERANDSRSPEGTAQHATGLNSNQVVDANSGTDSGESSGGSDDDWMSALDSVLSQMEGEFRAEAREKASPTKDALNVRGPREDGYKHSALSTIQSDQINSAPGLAHVPGQRVLTPDPQMRGLLQRNLLAAYQAHDNRRSTQPRMV